MNQHLTHDKEPSKLAPSLFIAGVVVSLWLPVFTGLSAALQTLGVSPPLQPFPLLPQNGVSSLPSPVAPSMQAIMIASFQADPVTETQKDTQ